MPAEELPEESPPARADDPALVPEPAPPPPAADVAVGVTALAPPGLGAVGLPRAAEALQGGGGGAGRPLWGGEAPDGLAAALARLPARVDDPALRRLQRDLLLAPGPRTGAGEDVLAARVERLLAMGEAQAAADLLGQAPDPGSAALAPTRVATLLAADRVEPACAQVERAVAPPPGGGDGEDRFWAEARLVCAALGGDDARVELGLSLLAERGRPADPLLASLLLAAGDGARPAVTLREAPPPNPLLLPLLRRVPLRPEPAAFAAAAPPVIQAVAQNPTVPAALAPPAAEPPQPGPALPGLDGRASPVADWPAALESVPAPRRARWLAALDGLGAGPPEPALAGLPEAARLTPAEGIDLAAWRGLERALGEAPRGPILLRSLLLLDGRPREAAPLALRAALSALRGIGLEPAAREVAAAALAAGRGG
jgi:hypothetical protein